jgi:hypothetical protein
MRACKIDVVCMIEERVCGRAGGTGDVARRFGEATRAAVSSPLGLVADGAVAEAHQASIEEP